METRRNEKLQFERLQTGSWDLHKGVSMKTAG